jgi:addiction module HigA family antidote
LTITNNHDIIICDDKIVFRGGSMNSKLKDPIAIIKGYIKQAKVTPYRVGKDALIRSNRVSQILSGKRKLTVHLALKLAKYFGCNAEEWLRMQMEAELKKERIKLKEQLAQIKPLKVNAAK